MHSGEPQPSGWTPIAGRMTLVVALLAAALLVPAIAAASPVVADSNPSPGATGSGSGWGITPNRPQAAQTFTAIAGTLDSADFYLEKLGNPTGSMYAVVYAMTGTYGSDSVPTGPPLATSAAVNASTIRSYVPIPFHFDNTLSLAEGTHYAVALRYDGTDPNNWVSFRLDTARHHPGNPSLYQGSKWWPSSMYDAYFAVYENPPAPVVPTPASSEWSLALLAVSALGVAGEVMRRRAVS